MTYIIMNVIIGVGDVVESSFGHSIVCVKRLSIVCIPHLTGVTRFIDVCAINTDTMDEKRNEKANERKW